MPKRRCFAWINQWGSVSWINKRIWINNFMMLDLSVCVKRVFKGMVEALKGFF